MKSSEPLTAEELTKLYGQRRATALEPIALALRDHITDLFKGQPRIDRITTRAKDVKSFVSKALKKERKKFKYTEPLSQIQDQIGARIVTFFLSDVERLDAIVRTYFRPIESRTHVPDSVWEFGYFGKHYILLLPPDVVDDSLDQDLVPAFFELQIKTLFQHAWSEAEHDLGYKPGLSPLKPEEVRRLAFTSAQAWGADHIFDELFRERSESTDEIAASRQPFHR
jgi:putative GTP pyrophosphokinase